MIGYWNKWYKDITAPAQYGPSDTYRLGAEFLSDCMVEDWGCGKGWLSTLIPKERYTGIDGSKTPYANKIVDLQNYRSNTEGLFMRHVLEHNFGWKKILDNAVASFTRKMVLIVFTPFVEGQSHPIGWAKIDEEITVPDIGFNLDELTGRFGGATWRMEEHPYKPPYHFEHIFYLTK